MKKVITYFVLLFLFNTSFAQIAFNVVKLDVKCNHADYGDAEVNVTLTDPPYVYLWNTGDTTYAIHDLNEGTYSVLITDGSGDDTTVVVQINLLECEMAPEIVFTPNNDGINDTWSIQNSEFFPQAKIMVFNRLGQAVFQQNGIYEPWDGKDLFGVTVPDASYYYLVYHNGKDEGTIIKGSVTIVK
jgi:gliding motility-associated-like protein